MVYKFECDLCDADYVGWTTRHLHQHINEHKCSAIGRHLEEHGLSKTDLDDKQPSVLQKYRSKFDCPIFEMLFIKELNPDFKTLFVQYLYVTLRVDTFLHYHHIFLLLFVSLRNSFYIYSRSYFIHS